MRAGVRRWRAPAVTVAIAPQRALADVPADAADRDAVGDRAERLAARALLRMLLPGPVAIGTRATGQPYLPERPDLSISLSHDGGHVAAAVAVRGAVGVDVQVPVPAPAALIRRCCRPPVGAELAALPAAERDREFAWIWTVQEACVKATGAGLAGRPWTVPVRPAQRRGRWNGVRWTELRSFSAVPLSVAIA